MKYVLESAASKLKKELMKSAKKNNGHAFLHDGEGVLVSIDMDAFDGDYAYGMDNHDKEYEIDMNNGDWVVSEDCKKKDKEENLDNFGDKKAKPFTKDDAPKKEADGSMGDLGAAPSDANPMLKKVKFKLKDEKNELLGFSKKEKADKSELQKIFKGIKSTDINTVWDTLAKASRNGNERATAELKGFERDPKYSGKLVQRYSK